MCQNEKINRTKQKQKPHNLKTRNTGRKGICKARPSV